MPRQRVWLNVSEAAEYAGVCRDTIYTACERGELEHVRIGGRRSIRLKREMIDARFERHTQDEPHATQRFARGGLRPVPLRSGLFEFSA